MPDGSLKNVLSKKQFDEQFSQTYDQKKQDILNSRINLQATSDRLKDEGDGRTLMPE